MRFFWVVSGKKMKEEKVIEISADNEKDSLKLAVRDLDEQKIDFDQLTPKFNLV